MVQKVNDKLYSWASIVDPNTIEQAERTARLPIVHGHVALMADAHYGLGATVGSVVPTKGAIIPSCVGVDIGCGMAAVETDLTSADLPDSLDGLLPLIAKAIPSGVGQGHDRATRSGLEWLTANPIPSEVKPSQTSKAAKQLGSLGSGNHFAEVSLSTTDQVWLVLHSGSRGIGNELARRHIEVAKGLAPKLDVKLEDLDLAWLSAGTSEFEAYIADLLWAQAYARVNREVMLDRSLAAMFGFVGKGGELSRVQCHHNYAVEEQWDGHTVWVTRKGAISARVGERGVIPGSMGTDSYIVEGLGSDLAWASSSHGAGRAMSRNKARAQLTAASLTESMQGRTWLAASADKLVDEHPSAYKPIEQVMADQADLVRAVERLSAVLNYKGI